MSTKVDMKVVLLGREYGGKTSLVERFIRKRFNENVPYQNTVGAAFCAKSVAVDGKSTTLGIWDTTGSERYESMTKGYYRGAKAAIVCYDLTDQASWDKVEFWVKELQVAAEDCKIYLCGTKKDKLQGQEASRATNYQDTVDYADFIKARIFETSSKTGENVEKLFKEIAQDFIQQNGTHHYNVKEGQVALGALPSKSNRGKECCLLD